ncbi:MAG: hypothetical protein IT208_16605 [Chthonomonadales bacterium]|nr:hypothetical protein [Chthonomonadales bacterium]
MIARLVMLLLVLPSAAALGAPRRPPAPRILEVATRGATARLRWAPVAGAIAYRVYTGGAPGPSLRAAALVRGGARWSGALPADGLLAGVVAAVDARGRTGPRSALVRWVQLVRPWGLAARPGGGLLLQDAHYAEPIELDARGSALRFPRVLGRDLPGCYDVAVGAGGRTAAVHWGDARDPRPGLRLRRGGAVVDRRLKEGAGPGQLRKPMGIGLAPDGRVFVADTGNDRLQEFTADGRFVRVVGDDELEQPMKVACGPDGRLYVADSGHNRVAIFAPGPGGRYRLVASLTGGMKEPVYVALDARGRVWASTNRNAGVYVLNDAGDVLLRFDGADGPPGSLVTGPRGIAFAAGGDALVVDEAARRIVRVTAPGPS